MSVLYVRVAKNRDLALGIRKDRWPDFIRMAKERLRPGGFIQMLQARVDPICSDGSVSKDAAIFNVIVDMLAHFLISVL